MKKPTTRHLLFICSLSAVSCLFYGCGSEEPASEVIPRVKVMTVGELARGQSRRISGKLQAASENALSFGVSGKIISELPNEGDLVTEGQSLAGLDRQSLEIRLNKARAKLTESRAAAEEAKQVFERTQTLFKQRGASKQELDSGTARLAASQSALSAAEGELEQAKIDLAKGTLIAPFSGRVSSVQADRFQEVTANQTILTLQSSEAMEVEVQVPETLIQHVDYGQVVSITFPSLPDLTLPGVVTTIAPQTSGGNAFPVTVTVSRGNEDLRAGITAAVTFNFDEYLQGRTVYLVPLSSIAVNAGLLNPSQYQPDEASGRKTAPVFILNPEAGIIREQKVVIGELRDNKIEVYDGLQAGDLVVTAGAAFLTDGMRADKWDLKSEPIR